jgi:hypothetical protein
MHIITQIIIKGITRLKVKIRTDDIEAIRKECAKTYNVKTGKIKFVYNTIDINK